MKIRKFYDDDGVFKKLARLENFFSDVFEDGDFKSSPLVQTNWAPKIDIKEKKDSYEVTAEFPGMNKEDIEISLEDNILVFKGEKKFEEKKEEDNYLHIERSYGNFYRSFKLPEAIDTEKVDASFKNGVLHLVLKKKPESKGKKIEIKGE